MEVMVAMLVMMLVFVATATLIIQSLNLVTVSRTKTEVAAIAQRAMTEAIIQIKTSCPVYGGASTIPLSFTPTPAGKYTIAVTTTSVELPASGVTQGYTYSFDASGFYEVKVAMSWKDKGATNQSTYNLTQLVAPSE